MSLLEPGVGEQFTLRIKKVHSARPDTPWYNSYELVNNTAATLGELHTACLNIVEFEQELHRQTTVFTQYTLSSWEPDSDPYNPDVFVTVPLTRTGAVSALDQAESLETCWRVAWQPVTGRVGFRLYRNCLSEGDVTAPAGRKIFENGAAMGLRLLNAVSDANIGPYFNGGPGDVHFAMLSATSIRLIVGVNLGGITLKKLDNRHFDRAP